jgi:ADP-ribose pyrophosphatase YjhB (NUDIX family)
MKCSGQKRYSRPLKDHHESIIQFARRRKNQLRQAAMRTPQISRPIRHLSGWLTDMTPPHSFLAKLQIMTARAARPFMHLYWRMSRGLTLGVRGLVIDDEGRVFLVKHTYIHGWHLPGGGVEPGEAVLNALARELKEEGNIELVDMPTLFGVYFQPAVSRRDHVVLFVVRHFRQPAPPVPDREIMAHGFFSREALPHDTSTATRARIAEVMTGAPVSPRW